MKALQELNRSQHKWVLEEFVRVTNDLLPEFLPETKGNERVRDEVTPRLVRHYTSLGMLDEATKEKKYAIYTYRHLLQILVVRRLLAEGFGANAIGGLATEKTNTELESLLTGGVQLTVTPTNPVLANFEESSSIKNSIPIANKTSAQTQKLPMPANSWQRLEIIPGLEIHVRSDFKYPQSLNEQKLLLQLIAEKLKNSTNS